MKSKFRIIALTVLCLLLLVPTIGSAATGFDPSEQSSVTSNGTDGRNIIPVYGYIGPDTTIVDPGPTDPGVKPESEIYVEVPVKILFAAFEGDKGAISSPDYTITNLSTVSDVKVEIEDFSQKNGAEAALGGKLSLSLENASGVAIVDGVFPASYPPAKVFTNVLPKKSDSADNVLAFKVGGSWSGGFQSELNPVFDMTLRFSVVKAD